MKHYILKITCVCLMFMSTNLMAQTTVSGTVSDGSGPLTGSTVKIQGTTTGAITDLDGNYKIEVPNAQAVLEFSFVGYQNKTVTVGNQSIIDVLMIEDAEQLEEVVVNALGFKEKKDNLGSTHSTVKAADLTRSGETGVINGLAGKASGVKIARSNGDPGAGSTIQIRGQNTITGSSGPLIIVDGVPLNNETIYGGGNSISGGVDAGVSQQSRLNDINPNDIATMQVLKGASAASLWGSRAANGVIIITTKSGKAGKINVSYGVTYSADKINLKHPLQSTFGQGDRGEYDPADSQSWGDKISDRSGNADVFDTSGQYFEAADGTLHYPITEKNSQDLFLEQNFDQVFQTGNFLQHDLSISGGSQKSTFFFSAGILDQAGIIKESFYDRRNLRLNTTTQLTDWFNFSSKAAYTYTSSNRIQQSSNVSGLYLGLLRTPADFDNSDYIGTYYNASGEATPRRHRSYRRYLANNVNPTYNNPNWTVFEQRNTTKVHRFLLTEEMNFDPTEWLTFKIRGGVDYYTDNRDYFFPVHSASSRRVGIYAEDVIQNLELNFDAIAKANFELSENTFLNATVGWNINDIRNRNTALRITGFSVNTTLATFANAGDDLSSINRRLTNRRSNRGYGVVGLNIKDQFFFNGSGAIEAHSTIDGSIFYPSLDAAWKFTESPVFDNVEFLSFGKLRTSWGQVGVQPRPHRGQTLTDAGFSVSSFSDPLDVDNFGGGFRLDNSKGNNDLKPEIKTETELGLDLRFLDDKIGLGFTYYYNKIEDLLFFVDLPTSTGFEREYTNAGSMENKGIELDLNYQVLDNDDWKVNVYTNFNNNENKVLDLKGVESIDLAGENLSISSRAVVGHSLGTLWAAGSLRDDAGQLILDDNGFPQTAGERGVIGDPNPDWRGGAGISASYKNFDLNVLFEHSQGGDFANRTKIVLYEFGTHADIENEVTLTQDMTAVDGTVFTAGTTVRGNIQDFGGGPVLLEEVWYSGRGGGFGEGVLYDLYVADATWTRLREISLSYTLNNDWLRNKLGLSSAQFSVTGRNLALWTDVVGIDPEISQTGVGNAFGIDYFTNPSTKSFLFSLKITY